MRKFALFVLACLYAMIAGPVFFWLVGAVAPSFEGFSSSFRSGPAVLGVILEGWVVYTLTRLSKEQLLHPNKTVLKTWTWMMCSFFYSIAWVGIEQLVFFLEDVAMPFPAPKEGVQIFLASMMLSAPLIFVAHQFNAWAFQKRHSRVSSGLA